MRPRSKTVATWLAVVLGALGAHRFYLHGWRDPWGWCLVPAALLGAAGAQRMRAFGVDDAVGGWLVLLLGAALVAAMLAALVYGLTPAPKWAARYGAAPEEGEPSYAATNWLTVLGVITALVLGSSVLMATIAYGTQRVFEWQLKE